jgi:hypothetical protein
MKKRRSKTSSVDKHKFGTSPKNFSRIEEENEQSMISSGRIRSAKRNKGKANENVDPKVY